jgi:hypothetical protein
VGQGPTTTNKGVCDAYSSLVTTITRHVSERQKRRVQINYASQNKCNEEEKCFSHGKEK